MDSRPLALGELDCVKTDSRCSMFEKVTENRQPLNFDLRTIRLAKSSLSVPGCGTVVFNDVALSHIRTKHNYNLTH